MFPGHPYLEQEKRRAEHEGEREERRRVETLIRLAREAQDRQLRRIEAELLAGEPDDRVLLNKRFEALGAKKVLEDLGRKVRLGHHR